jgi:hypothetical protein
MKIYTRFLFLLGLSLLLLGCTSNEDLRPTRDCPIEELLLSQFDYPPNTILNASRSPIAEKPSESAGGSANYNGDATSQLVARHSSVENAVKEYEKWENIAFDADDVIGIWETPEILKLKEISADRQKIACGNLVSFGKRCYMVGQYEEYFVFFWADISTKGITPELFRDLVISIDEEMASCLSR